MAPTSKRISIPAAAPETSAAPAAVLLRSSLLGELPWLCHGFSTRKGGVSVAYRPAHTRVKELNLGETPDDDPANVAENRRRFLEALVAGSPLKKLPRLVAVHQVHTAAIWRDPKPGLSGDGLLTDRVGQALSIRVADCVPILLADVKTRAVAALHAGWRGTLQRIAEKGVGEMRAHFGSRPEDLRVAIGPSIRRCCFDVGPEVVEAFQSTFDYGKELFSDYEDDPVKNRYPMLFMTGAPPGHPYDPRWNYETPARLDLAEANRRQLLAAGVPETNIDVMPYCTKCRADLFFSHRRDEGRTGRMAAAICRVKR